MEFMAVPKRRFQTTLSRVITQKTEKFNLIAAKAYDHAQSSEHQTSM
jgi:hypothetical protein